MMTRKEAARFLGLAVKTLTKMAALPDKGGLPLYKIGRIVRYKLDDLQTFLERHRVEARVGAR